MIRKIQRVELQTSANIVTKGDTIILTANLSDVELDSIRAQNGILEYAVNAETADVNASDPRSATWKMDLPAGEYPATVTLVSDDKRFLLGETRIHAVNTIR